MIQERPRCFDCSEVVEYDAVYAPPFCEHPECASAVFHGICLMTWRERRADHMAIMDKARSAFMRHLDGDCNCPPQ